MVIRNVLLATEAGLGNGETPIFPIHIFKVKEGVNYNAGDPNYDLFKLACRVSRQAPVPELLLPRRAVQPAVLQARPSRDRDRLHGLPHARYRPTCYDPTREIVNGRGNLSFTSINLPRLGHPSQQATSTASSSELDRKMSIWSSSSCSSASKSRRAKKVRNYPFLMGQGIWLDSDKLGPDDEVRRGAQARHPDAWASSAWRSASRR